MSAPQHPTEPAGPTSEATSGVVLSPVPADAGVPAQPDLPDPDDDGAAGGPSTGSTTGSTPAAANGSSPTKAQPPRKRSPNGSLPGGSGRTGSASASRGKRKRR